MVELGLGLVSIGRPWGVRGEAPPAEDEALALLHNAVALGIRFFDTAPAYGPSEAILGRFLRAHGRNGLTVATKMGESWDPERGSSVDHRFESLKRSIDRSLQRLGRVDVLQVHKSTAENLQSPDVLRAIEYARDCGIRHFGASVSDLAAAAAATRQGWCSYLQFPYSRANAALAPLFALARAAGVKLLVNRPFAMGALAQTPVEAFRFIRQQEFAGVILSGTKSIRHLTENHAAFSASGS